MIEFTPMVQFSHDSASYSYQIKALKIKTSVTYIIIIIYI